MATEEYSHPSGYSRPLPDRMAETLWRYMTNSNETRALLESLDINDVSGDDSYYQAASLFRNLADALERIAEERFNEESDHELAVAAGVRHPDNRP